MFSKNRVDKKQGKKYSISDKKETSDSEIQMSSTDLHYNKEQKKRNEREGTCALAENKVCNTKMDYNLHVSRLRK